MVLENCPYDTKFNTRDVAKSFYVNFLKKAQECFHAAVPPDDPPLDKC